MKLDEYNKKRDFSKTEEPKGNGEKDKKSEKIFVIQKHAASRLHYDFRLEWEGVLLSWAVPKGPSYNPKDKRLAVEVEPHPYDYKDFEGTIPKGEYGGGTVMIWDEGTWEIQEGEDFGKGLEKGSIKIILSGERLKGKWALVRMKARDNEEEKNWLLIKERDEFAKDSSGISDFKVSVRTGKSMEEIEDKNGEINNYDVQLATLRKTVPTGDNWIYELKYDGYRLLAYINHGKVKLMTRNHQDYTEKFPDLVKELKNWKDSGVIDGEIVVNKEGRSSFQSLQNYIKTKKGPKPVFMAFDLLNYNDKELVAQPLEERRKLLEEIIKRNEGKSISFSRNISGDGKFILKTVCENGYEGVICKKKDGIYKSGRNYDWVKVKCKNSQEFIILGFTQTENRIRAFSSLLLGTYDGDELIYVGRVGTGFSEEVAQDIMKKLKPLVRKTSPLSSPPKKRYNEEITWVSPKLIANVNFSEWTDDGLLRQASFQGLREDKEAKEVVREEAGDDDKENGELDREVTVKLTSPDKKMIGNYTKKDLFDYYDKISPLMIPYLAYRLVSLFRCPDGISKDCFYQKHMKEELEGIFKETIEDSGGGEGEYIYFKDKIGLLQSVQYGTIEFHTWGSKIDNLEKPDMIVFDLDPDEGMDIETVREGVRDLKSILDDLGLKSFLKTSGGKGYHIVVPLKPKANWEEVRDFSKNIAMVMEQKWPDKYTSNMRKEKRKGKIYVDWVRNGRSATSVSPYSLRARKAGGISWPVDWKDLDKILPNEITIEKAIKFKGKDPWENFFEVEQSIDFKK